jgi:hypothetical protein
VTNAFESRSYLLDIIRTTICVHKDNEVQYLFETSTGTISKDSPQHVHNFDPETIKVMVSTVFSKFLPDFRIFNFWDKSNSSSNENERIILGTEILIVLLSKYQDDLKKDQKSITSLLETPKSSETTIIKRKRYTYWKKSQLTLLRLLFSKHKYPSDKQIIALSIDLVNVLGLQHEDLLSLKNKYYKRIKSWFATQRHLIKRNVTSRS